MSDLRACAKRVDAASGDILCGGQAYLGYVKDSQELARAILSSLDVPDERYRFMAIYEMIPKQFRVAVCEGGGEPDWESSVCVSIAKMRDSIANPIRLLGEK